ncbi:Mu-like prophage major head subunit gpT family protein [Brytella acorum]|uniref:Mu-like prophage major head subunit gpT family protein n=1 Tax=Brytella acorum TaxID=2959299 RepID=A0AA35Y3Q3_9PROT|nr:Mu-like prophage major head subunit gpT family protein [Brytella acorum]MDF3623343.1 Mu-like prophage major head subunit gpT family protein [Brytella acorum]CAI9120422.1 Mu-like prophage major head subunit gpT family protein [Brytella acorum]
MNINQSNIDAFFVGLSTAFNKSLATAPSYYKDISMVIPSATRVQGYAWLNNIPRIREWIGSRSLNQLGSQGFQVENKTWESTIAIKREEIEDDQHGIYTPIFEEMAQAAVAHRDELIFKLLGEEFVQKCYDGQNFFDTEHPVNMDNASLQKTCSNVFGSGNCAPWFLLDCSRPIRPLLFQARRPATLVAKTNLRDDNVFFNNQFLYGVDARYNVGYGLWQTAFACTDPLTPYNYAVVRAAMMSQTSDTGRPLGIRPTHLVTTPGNEHAALRILRSEMIAATTNEWAGSAVPIITQFLLEASNATPVWNAAADFILSQATYGSGYVTTANGQPPSASGGA